MTFLLVYKQWQYHQGWSDYVLHVADSPEPLERWFKANKPGKDLCSEELSEYLEERDTDHYTIRVRQDVDAEQRVEVRFEFIKVGSLIKPCWLKISETEIKQTKPHKTIGTVGLISVVADNDLFTTRKCNLKRIEDV